MMHSISDPVKIHKGVIGVMLFDAEIFLIASVHLEAKIKNDLVLNRISLSKFLTQILSYINERKT